MNWSPSPANFPPPEQGRVFSMGQATILQQIIERKHQELKQNMARVSFAEMEAAFPARAERRFFAQALRSRIAKQQPAVIAEIKKASPSKGVIRPDFDPEALAQDYAAHGAACLSVLTDEQFFQGCNEYLQQARAACDLPVLRKDFMLHPYQIAESKALGADCILLIVAALDPGQLKELSVYAANCDLDVLVEVHNEAELELALQLDTDLIGINNRDLHSFNTDLALTFRLQKLIPGNKLIITESGINSRQDVESMLQAGIYGFLIGETFMRAESPGRKLQELMSRHD